MRISLVLLGLMAFVALSYSKSLTFLEENDEVIERERRDTSGSGKSFLVTK